MVEERAVFPLIFIDLLHTHTYMFCYTCEDHQPKLRCEYPPFCWGQEDENIILPQGRGRNQKNNSKCLQNCWSQTCNYLIVCPSLTGCRKQLIDVYLQRHLLLIQWTNQKRVYVRPLLLQKTHFPVLSNIKKQIVHTNRMRTGVKRTHKCKHEENADYFGVSAQWNQLKLAFVAPPSITLCPWFKKHFIKN